MGETTADDRFVLRVLADGSVRIDIGSGFTEADVPAMIAAENALAQLIPRQRD